MDVDLSKSAAFATPGDWGNWLRKHHDSESVLWLRIYKKDSAVASVTWEEAVVEALAWGWIDGLKKSGDAQSYFQRFTPRGPRSSWSQKNIGHVEKLIAEGRVQPPGLVHVEAAKKDGRWEKAYAGSRDFEVPEDFVAAVKRNKKATATFESLSRAQLYMIYVRLLGAKRPETREKRFRDFLDLLRAGKKPG